MKPSSEEAQSFRAEQSLNALAAQAAADFQRLLAPVASLIEQTTAAQAHTALLTENTRFQKMWASMAEENTRFRQFQQELWTALPRIESRWKEDQERLQRTVRSTKRATRSVNRMAG